MAGSPPDPEGPGGFIPRQRAPRRSRRLAYLLGPLVWVIALVVLAIVIRRSDAVEVALACVLVSIIVGLAASLLLRRGRLREERRA